MDSQISSNSRVAKNAVMLSVRMLLIMVVSLYTSRVVLNILGIEDYGIYGVVGGFVAMVAFLNSSMSIAISRFLMFNLGKGDREALKKTFYNALFTQLILVVIIIVLSETIGLWLLYHKMVIPEGRMTAAFWTFQASILCMVIAFIQTPFNASIMAHEKMGVYAYIEILNSILKLAVVYVLLVVNADKLILYSFLIVAVHLLIFMIYYIYGRTHFEECRLKVQAEKEILKPILSFSGWDVFKSSSVSVRQWGNNFLINIFFGVLLNAASTVATTIYGMIMGLANNVNAAFAPKIVKLYASRQMGEMISSIKLSTIVAVVIMGCITVPTILEMPYLIRLWLGKDIQYAPEFCSVQMMLGFFSLATNVVVSGILATGKVKKYCLIYGSVYLLSLPVSYILLRLGGGALSTYWVCLATGILLFAITSFLLSNLVQEFSATKIIGVFLASVLVVLISAVPSVLIHLHMPESFMRVVVIGLVNMACLLPAAYFILLGRESRQTIKLKMRRLLKLEN